MYVGPWQEYRLGQMFNEQTRLLAGAVRQQIQQQILQEQAAQPQVQLPHANRRSHSTLSYSQSLRHVNGGDSSASLASTRSAASSQFSLHTPTLHHTSSSQPGTAYSISSNASHGHPVHVGGTIRVAGGGNDSQGHLPPIQAAARAAVESFTSNRLRATANHPLSHVVNSYYPDALSNFSSVSSPSASNRPSSRMSSKSSHSEPNPNQLYYTNYFDTGGNPALQYRPPQYKKPKPRPVGPNGARGKILSSKEAAKHAAVQAHHEHLARMRSLYGLQTASEQNAQAKKELEQTAQQQTNNNLDTTTQQQHQAAQQLVSPKNLAPIERRSSMEEMRAIDQAFATKPSLPAAPIPIITKSNIALFGPLSQEVQDSLYFYASSSHKSAHELPKIKIIDDTPPPPPPKEKSLDWLTKLNPVEPTPDIHDVTPPPTFTAAAAGAAAGAAAAKRASIEVPPGVNLSLVISHPQRGERRQSQESRFTFPMHVAKPAIDIDADLQKQHLASTGGGGGIGLVPKSNSNSRLTTPAQRRNIHSSGGLSESGDFENEVNELLGWTAEQQHIDDEHSHRAGGGGESQLMSVHT